MGPQGNHQGTPSFSVFVGTATCEGWQEFFDGIMAGLEPPLSQLHGSSSHGSQLANGENTGLLTTWRLARPGSRSSRSGWAPSCFAYQTLSKIKAAPSYGLCCDTTGRYPSWLGLSGTGRDLAKPAKQPPPWIEVTVENPLCAGHRWLGLGIPHFEVKRDFVQVRVTLNGGIETF